MASDTATTAAGSDCEVMASVDGDDDDQRLVIAELCRDDAWLAMSLDGTAAVEDWR